MREEEDISIGPKGQELTSIMMRTHEICLQVQTMHKILWGYRETHSDNTMNTDNVCSVYWKPLYLQAMFSANFPQKMNKSLNQIPSKEDR